MSGDERYVLDEAQAEIKRLTAENARLRGEAKKWCDAWRCTFWLGIPRVVQDGPRR
jgi:hypothetical protein